MLRFRRRLMVAGLALGVAGGLGVTVGCLPRQADDEGTRAQAEPDPEKEPAASVGTKTVIGNTEPISVTAVGLVLGLKGTGSSPPPDGHREAMEKVLKRLQHNPKVVLDDPNKSTSLVLVSGVIPAGSRSGEKLACSGSSAPPRARASEPICSRGASWAKTSWRQRRRVSA